MQIDNRSKKAFYREEGITASEVFAYKGVKFLAAANESKKVPTKYASTGTKR